MKVVKKTGLVPVYEPKNAAHIFGATPEEAIKGVGNGTLILVADDVIKAAKVETFDYDLPKAVAKTVAGKPADDNDGLVEIPDDWKTLHYMKQIMIAREINPDLKETEDKKLSVVAVETIEAELSRRANPDADPGALGTKATSGDE